MTVPTTTKGHVPGLYYEYCQLVK